MNINYLASALLSGILLAFTTPLLGAFWPVLFIAFVPLLYAVETGWTRKRIGFGGALFLGLLAGGFYYAPIYVWLINFTAWSLPLTALGYAVHYGLWTAGICLGFRAGLRGTALSLWTACLWVSLEVLFSGLFIPVPSCAVGYQVWTIPLLIQTADITGPYFNSFWIIAVNIFIARMLLDGLRVPRLWAGVVVAVTLTVIGYGYIQSGVYTNTFTGKTKDKPLTVTLVQSAVDTKEKEKRRTISAAFARLAGQTHRAAHTGEPPPDLAVWPETSVPVYLRSVTEKDIVETLLRTARETAAPILMGALAYDRSGEDQVNAYNTAFIVPPRGYISQEYRKVILAPFYEWWPFFEKLPPSVRDRLEEDQLTPGRDPGVLELGAGRLFGVFICWEAYFPDFVRKLPLKGALFLVSITNDHAYFGSIKRAYDIPLPHVVFRAVETRRHIARCSNMGLSMVVSPRGDIVASAPQGRETVLTASVLPERAMTFLVRHGFIVAKGFAWLTFIWAAALVYRGHWRNRT